MGFARIRNCKALNKWVEDVVHIRQVAVSRETSPFATPPVVITREPTATPPPTAPLTPRDSSIGGGVHISLDAQTPPNNVMFDEIASAGVGYHLCSFSILDDKQGKHFNSRAKFFRFIMCNFQHGACPSTRREIVDAQ